MELYVKLLVGQKNEECAWFNVTDKQQFNMSN